MPKKKSKKQGVPSDFTINDCANAAKPVGRVKKSAVAEPIQEKSWEDLQDDDLEAIVQKTKPEGTKELKKKRNHSKCEVDICDRPGIEYPEVVWYLISPYIIPEEIGNFAGINRATYYITKRESFWRALYKRYCQNKHKLLPEKYRIDNDYKLYGLRLRVIRALYHTYDVFIQKVLKETDLINGCSRPYDLIGRRCVNVWYSKDYCSLYFKLKQLSPVRAECDDFLKELGRIDANPEEGTKVLQVICLNYSEVPPLLGLTLTSVRVTLSQTCRHRRLYLGFNRSHNNVFIERQPECSVCINSIVSMLIYDWWDPKYPHFEIKLPTYMREEESVPVLKKDFFSL